MYNVYRGTMSDCQILVTGASGFIGRALVAELERRGHSVRCAVRNIESVTGLSGALIEVGDVNASTDWTRALDGVHIVIHLVARAHILNETAIDPLAAFNAVNLDGTRRLAESAAAQGVRRMVYVSSIGVNGDSATPQNAFTEASIPMPHNAYAASKYAAEQALSDVARRTGLETVILRPPLVYGPGNPGNFLRLLKLVDRGIPIPLASVSNRRSMIYVDNLVDALITAAIKHEAAGQLYLVCDNETVSTPHLIAELGERMEKPIRLWPFPVSGLRLAGKILGRSLEIERVVGSLVIDGGKIRRELQWSPPYTLQQGLEHTVRWFQGEVT